MRQIESSLRQQRSEYHFKTWSRVESRLKRRRYSYQLDAFHIILVCTFSCPKVRNALHAFWSLAILDIKVSHPRRRPGLNLNR